MFKLFDLRQLVVSDEVVRVRPPHSHASNGHVISVLHLTCPFRPSLRTRHNQLAYVKKG